MAAEELRLTVTTSTIFKRLKGTRKRDHDQAGPWDVVVEDPSGAVIVHARECTQPFQAALHGLDAVAVDWNMTVRCIVPSISAHPRIRVHALYALYVNPLKGGLEGTAAKLLWDFSAGPNASIGRGRIG